MRKKKKIEKKSQKLFNSKLFDMGKKCEDLVTSKSLFLWTDEQIQPQKVLNIVAFNAEHHRSIGSTVLHLLNKIVRRKNIHANLRSNSQILL